ncbi:unnamed protein product, partial [Nesidiocoris tenuis]
SLDTPIYKVKLRNYSIQGSKFVSHQFPWNSTDRGLTITTRWAHCLKRASEFQILAIQHTNLLYSFQSTHKHWNTRIFFVFGNSTCFDFRGVLKFDRDDTKTTDVKRFDHAHTIWLALIEWACPSHNWAKVDLDGEHLCD